MNFEDLHHRLQALQAHYSVSPEKLIDRIIFSYYKKVLEELTSLMKDTPVDKRNEAIEGFLTMNWDRINGTCLSYTALPDSDVTALLCDLANALPKTGSKGVVSYLMPTVSTESIRTPQYPDLGPIQDSNTEEWIADPVDDVHFLLKTHVLGREGEYLIPIQLLIDDEIDSSSNNVYFNVEHHDSSMTTLDSEEWDRLYQHAPLTKALHEAIGQGELLCNEKLHLLGHLTTLINQLQFNSASGVGQELTAGEGAYNAIVQFHRYYDVLEASEKNRMPEALIQALDKLFLLASDPAANTLATGALSVDTCIATRRTDILNALQGHEALLADIGLTGTQKSELIAENERQITALKNELKTQITEKRYSNGHDSLGITRALLQTFNCPIDLKTPEDVADLVCHLSPNEITALCRDDLLCEKIVTVIKSLENLIMLYMQLSPERLTALNSAISERLAKNILSSGDKLKMMLGLFDAEKRRLIIESFMPFKTANGSRYLGGLFFNPQADVFEMMRESLPVMIQGANDFNQVMLHLSREQRTAVYISMEARLPGMIQTVGDFSNILRDLSPEQRSVVFEAMKERLPDMIQTARDFWGVLSDLSPEQIAFILTAKEALLRIIIPTVDDYCDAMRGLSSEKRTVVSKAMEARLPGMIQTPRDFWGVLSDLSPEQIAFILTAKEAHLRVIIPTANDYCDVIRILSSEKRTVVFKAMEARLPEMIKSVADFNMILFYCSLEQGTALCTVMEVRLNVPIKTIIVDSVIRGNLGLLSPESYIFVMQALLPREDCEKDFFVKYNSFYQQARNGFFGSLRRSTCNPEWNLNEILHDAKTHNNRCREACVALGWMTKNGGIHNGAPEAVRSAYNSTFLQKPVVNRNDPSNT